MTACPVCGGCSAVYLPGLLKCPACGLTYKTERYFGSPAYAPELEADIYGAAKGKLFAEALDFLDKALPGWGRLLDIGCAGGELLKAAAARGWKPEGVELDAALAMKAVALGFEVYPRPVEEALLDSGAYRAVTVFDTFSQMDKPAAAAAELYRLLAPGGAIYIREFNAGFHIFMAGLERRGAFSPLGASPAVLHNFNFSAKTLRVMLGRAGFTDVRIRNSRPTAGDPYRTGGRLGGFLTAGLKVLYYWLAQALWFLTFGRVFAGSTLIATARKPWPSESQRPGYGTYIVMKAAIHQLQYWPGLRFFSKMRAADLFIYLDDVQFEKREFQNRNRIRTARGWQYLTAPVVSKGRFSQKINEVELENSDTWREQHLRAIKTNYARAPFFKKHLPALEELYSRDYRLLADLATATMDFLKDAFGIMTPVRFSSELKVEETSSARLARLCAAAGADEYLSGAGAKAYLDPGVFSYAGIKLSWQEFKPAAYPQAFPGFEPDMSALDLLLNCGPRSGDYL